MRKFSRLIQAVLLVLSVSAWAEVYSLMELLPAAVAADAEGHRIESSADEARLRIQDARGAFQPRVEVSGQAAYISELPQMTIGPSTITAGVKDTYATALTARQLLFAGFSRTAAVQNAENSLARTLYEAENRADAVRFKLVQAAFALNLADLSVDSLNASLARIELNRRRVNSFFTQGFASELDLLEVDSSVTELKLKLNGLRADRNSALIMIRQLSGKEDLQGLRLDEEFVQVPGGEDFFLKPDDLRENTNYKLTDYSLRTLEISGTVDKAGWYPKVSAFGSLNYGRPGANIFSDQWQFYYKGGVEVSFDIWDAGARSHAAGITESKIRGVQALREKIYTDLVTRGEQTVESLKSLESQYRTAGELLTQKQRKYRLVQDLWQAGQKSTIDVLAAEQELTEADISLKTIKIRLLSLYQEFLFLINQPAWKQGEQK